MIEEEEENRFACRARRAPAQRLRTGIERRVLSRGRGEEEEGVTPTRRKTPSSARSLRRYTTWAANDPFFFFFSDVNFKI
jgi:hypothetical protein